VYSFCNKGGFVAFILCFTQKIIKKKNMKRGEGEGKRGGEEKGGKRMRRETKSFPSGENN
jgi:hypothetical protein